MIRFQLIIRTDANLKLGTGHFMRCMALAIAAKNLNIPVAIVTSQVLDSLQNLLSDNQIPHYVISQTNLEFELSLLKNISTENCAIILDSFDFTETYIAKISENFKNCAIIDDFGNLSFYPVKTIINYTLQAPHIQYSCLKETQKLLGEKFLILRKEFTPEKIKKSFHFPAKKILITLGGSDPDNLSETVLKKVLELSPTDTQFRLIMGSLSKSSFHNSLTQMDRVEIVSGTNQISNHMRWADLAISAAGTTSWELAYLRVPSILIEVVRNQREVATRLAERGMAFHLQKEDLFTEKFSEVFQDFLENSEIPKNIFKSSEGVFDNLGSERILNALFQD